MSYEDKWFGTAGEYTATFEDEYGYVPPYQAAESTAAVLVFADAIERAQSTDPDKVRRRSSLRISIPSTAISSSAQRATTSPSR